MVKENCVNFVDRTNWQKGPWDNEPDREEWRSQGFPCLIVRSQLGALCGYVGVPPEHPYHSINYDVDDIMKLEVHGGLTYSAACAGHTCHTPKENEPDNVWWLGFDCAHCNDIAPHVDAVLSKVPRIFPNIPVDFCTYKNMDYVRNEVEMLAKQLANIKSC